MYGATEFGAPAHTIPLAADVKAGEWSWIRFDSRAAIQMIPHGDGLFEAHFMVGIRICRDAQSKTH